VIQQGLNANALGSASYSCNYNAVTQRISITQNNGGGFTVYDDTTLKKLGAEGSHYRWLVRDASKIFQSSIASPSDEFTSRHDPERVVCFGCNKFGALD